MHAFTLTFFRRNLKRVWKVFVRSVLGAYKDGILGNGETKPEHVPDNLLDVGGIRYYGGDD